MSQATSAPAHGRRFDRLRRHWPEYVMDGALLGLFMISASLFTALLEHPDSPVRQTIPDPHVRRALIGAAMGLTAITLIYSPWGQRSGAHMNPAVTLSFLRLGKMTASDALGYITAQFVGGTVGVLLCSLVLGSILSHPDVNHAVTQPGPAGPAVAFLAEVAIAAGMMLMVLVATNTPRLARRTGWLAGLLVFLFITFEAPLSGMSLNPARTTASAIPSGIWTAWWIYLTAPVLGMLGVVEIFRARKRLQQLACPKLHHGIRQRCIFCGHPGTARRHRASAGSAPASCKVASPAATD